MMHNAIAANTTGFYIDCYIFYHFHSNFYRYKTYKPSRFPRCGTCDYVNRYNIKTHHVSGNPTFQIQIPSCALLKWQPQQSLFSMSIFIIHASRVFDILLNSHCKKMLLTRKSVTTHKMMQNMWSVILVIFYIATMAVICCLVHSTFNWL